MARTNFERLRVYQLSERLADQVWNVVLGWNNLARDTVGKQLIVQPTASEPISLKAVDVADIWITNDSFEWLEVL
jgi:hypothetical protein